MEIDSSDEDRNHSNEDVIVHYWLQGSDQLMNVGRGGGCFLRQKSLSFLQIDNWSSKTVPVDKWEDGGYWSAICFLMENNFGVKIRANFFYRKT